jgi:hypothetical protein
MLLGVLLLLRRVIHRHATAPVSVVNTNSATPIMWPEDSQSQVNHTSGQHFFRGSIHGNAQQRNPGSDGTSSQRALIRLVSGWVKSIKMQTSVAGVYTFELEASLIYNGLH